MGRFHHLGLFQTIRFSRNHRQSVTLLMKGKSLVATFCETVWPLVADIKSYQNCSSFTYHIKKKFNQLAIKNAWDNIYYFFQPYQCTTLIYSQVLFLWEFACCNIISCQSLKQLTKLPKPSFTQLKTMLGCMDSLAQVT
jgi:hypothetical protein